MQSKGFEILNFSKFKIKNFKYNEELTYIKIIFLWTQEHIKILAVPRMLPWQLWLQLCKTARF